MPIPDDDIDGIDGIDVDVDDLDADLLLALADEEQAPSGVLQALLTAVAGPWWAPFVRRAAGLLDLDTATTRDLFVGIADGDSDFIYLKAVQYVVDKICLTYNILFVRDGSTFNQTPFLMVLPINFPN